MRPCLNNGDTSSVNTRLRPGGAAARPPKSPPSRQGKTGEIYLRYTREWRCQRPVNALAPRLQCVSGWLSPGLLHQQHPGAWRRRLSRRWSVAISAAGTGGGEGIKICARVSDAVGVPNGHAALFHPAREEFCPAPFDDFVRRKSLPKCGNLFSSAYGRSKTYISHACTHWCTECMIMI